MELNKYDNLQDLATARNLFYTVFRDNNQEEFERYIQTAPEQIKKEYYKLKAFWIEIEKEFIRQTEQFSSLYITQLNELESQGVYEAEVEARKQVALYIRDHAPKYMKNYLLTMVFNKLTLYDILSQKDSHKPVKRMIDNYKQYTKRIREGDI